MATSQLSVSPAAKHRRSVFGFEPSYEKRWDSVIQLQVLQQKTPHRYQQSPVFSRKVMSCPPEESPHSKHHHHHHHHHNHHKRTPERRRRGISEGDKHNHSSSDERVHILSTPPWKKSDSSSSDNSLADSTEDFAVDRKMLFHFSPSLPQRLDSRLELEKRKGVSRSSHDSSPLAGRRLMKPRPRSQGSSPLPQRKHVVTEINTEKPNSIADPSHAATDIAYRGHLVINIQPVPEPPANQILSPDDPITPLAETNGFLQVPPMEHGSGGALPPPPSPHTLRRFLGLEDDTKNAEGLTEEDILKARLASRRYSSSSESSSSTLT